MLAAHRLQLVLISAVALISLYFSFQLSVQLFSCVPLAAQAFRDYRLGAVTLSAQMLAVVQRMLGGEAVAQPDSGLNRREWNELMGVLGRDA